MIWLRQMYMPGIRGALMVLVVNLVVMLIIRIVTRRMAQVALEHRRYIAHPPHRRLSHAHAR